MTETTRYCLSYYHSPRIKSIDDLDGYKRDRSSQRVILLFFGSVILPFIFVVIPLYLRHRIYADVVIDTKLAEMMEISSGISQTFCQAQTLRMNTTFDAFQVHDSFVKKSKQVYSTLNKRVTLPNKSFRYLRLFINGGTTVKFSMCSKGDDGKILIFSRNSSLGKCSMLHYDASKEKSDNNVTSKLESFPIIETNKPQTTVKKFIKYNVDISDISAFHAELLTCLSKEDLKTFTFTSSAHCTNYKYNKIKQYEINVSDYYYVMFYNNKLKQDDIVFSVDLEEPVHISEKHMKACLGKTQCIFPIYLWSNDKVIVDIPMNERKDDTVLISTCKPRVLVYAIFPIMVLSLFIFCSFM